jgi:flagellar protein FliL
MSQATETADAAEAAEAPPARRGSKGLLFGLLGGLLLGGAGFYAVYSGLPALGGGDETHPAAAELVEGVGFLPLEPIVVSLPPGGSARHLRFVGQLEIAPEHETAVARLMPRITDVLNTYLRAVEVRDFEDPAATARLRAQMLRRIEVVVGEGRVRDLLITEFVLS